MTQTPSAKPQKKRDPRLTMLLDGLKRIFIHNWPTKLLALLLAIILWGGLITQDPTLTREKHFSSVSVSVSGEESVKRNGFIVTSDLTSLLADVSLTADVPQMQYANAKATNYNVRIDLSRISSAGEQEIRILSTNSSTYGTVSSIQPSTVTIDVEEYITRFRIPVSVQTVGSAPEGYYAGAATLDPPTVTISGPKSMVDKIVRAEVVLELNNLPQREGTIRKALAYTLLDENIGRGFRARSPPFRCPLCGTLHESPAHRTPCGPELPPCRQQQNGRCTPVQWHPSQWPGPGAPSGSLVPARLHRAAGSHQCSSDVELCGTWLHHSFLCRSRF